MADKPTKGQAKTAVRKKSKKSTQKTVAKGADKPPVESGKADADTAFARAPLPRPKGFETVTIKTHKELFAKSREIARRVEAAPDFSVMFLSNPILALDAYGIKLGKDLQHHILNTLRHPPRLRARREELETALHETLGEVPKPTDPVWMAYLVFERQKIAPVRLGKLEPVYKAPLNESSIKRLQARRPKGGKRYSDDTRQKVRFSLRLAAPASAIRRLDLDAAVPPLKPAANAPGELTLEQAWFYKTDPVVRDAVELGQIMRRGFPFRTPAEFRKIAAGTSVDAFRRFIRGIRLKGVLTE